MSNLLLPENYNPNRHIQPLGDAIRNMFIMGEWQGLIKPRAYHTFQRFAGRAPYSLPRSKYPPLMGGAAGNWTFTDATRTDCFNGTYDWDTDSFKIALHLSTGTQPAAGTTVWSGLSTSEHAAANGYTAGGIAVTIALSGTTTLTVDSTTNPVWTATGGSIVARWGVLYEVAGRVPCYFLLDSTPADVTATDTNTLTITINASGVFTVA